MKGLVSTIDIRGHFERDLERLKSEALRELDIAKSEQIFGLIKVTSPTINITDSVVGAINTGTVKSIDVSVSVIEKHGDTELALAIKELTERIIQSIHINDAQRNEILEQLSFISKEATQPKEKRRWSLLKPIASTIGTSLSGVKDVLEIWEKLKTLLGF